MVSITCCAHALQTTDSVTFWAICCCVPHGFLGRHLATSAHMAAAWVASWPHWPLVHLSPPNFGPEPTSSIWNTSRSRVAARYSGGALRSRCFQEVESLGDRAGSWVWVKQQALNERIPPTRWGRTPWLVWCHLAGVSGQPPC